MVVYICGYLHRRAEYDAVVTRVHQKPVHDRNRNMGQAMFGRILIESVPLVSVTSAGQYPI